MSAHYCIGNPCWICYPEFKHRTSDLRDDGVRGGQVFRIGPPDQQLRGERIAILESCHAITMRARNLDDAREEIERLLDAERKETTP